jgi:hypothetical protein
MSMLEQSCSPRCPGWMTPGQLNSVGWRMPPSLADCFERGAKPVPFSCWIQPLSAR